jgi:flagellar hook protein FlgE
MSLYGALFSGVSGLNAQGSFIAAVGDNISNINTTGYKESTVNFSTLITDGSTSTTYASGGVLGYTRRAIDQQGLIQGTGVVTDVAISGEGMFVVNSESDDTGDFLYTRAGSFRKDSRGNFVNSSGYYLMAWPLDSEGRLPGEAGNLDTTSNALLESLEVVNVRSVSGVASATTRVDVGVNLKASQEIARGAGDTVLFASTSSTNAGVSAEELIIPSSRLGEGDSISLTPSTPGTTYTYNYGGFVYTNDVTASAIFNSNSASEVFSILPVAGGATSGSKFTITTETSGTVSFTLTPNSPNVTLGQFNSLNTLSDAINEVQGLTSRVEGGRLYIAPIDATEAITFADVIGTFSTSLGGNLATGTQAVGNRFATLQGLADLIADSTGLDSSIENPLGTASVDFFTIDPLGTLSLTATKDVTLGSNPFTSGAAGSTAVTVTYPGHGMSTGHFINITGAAVFDGLTVANGNYAVTVVDENTFTITASAGTATAGTTAGGGTTIEVLPGLGANPFTTTAGSSTVTATHTGHGLTTGDSITIAGAAAFDGVTIDGSYQVTVVDANTYTFTASAGAGIAGLAGGGAAATVDTGVKILAELGLETSGLAPESDVLGPAYDPTDGTTIPNMAAGGVTPHFSRNVRFFDALGNGHDFQISYLKIDQNTWAVEVYAVDPDEIVSSRTDGLVANGTVIFNGDGTLRSVSTSLSSPVEVAWVNEAIPNEITFNWGTAGQLAGTEGATTIGKADGLRQFNSDYDVQFIDQNGVAPGLLSSITIDADGFVTANFSNGETRNLYRIPIATFANANGLEVLAGNAYRESQGSGSFNLRLPGSGGAGIISASSLEQANVELAEQLTSMLVSQRAYQASSKVIQTADDLLEELNRLFQ